MKSNLFLAHLTLNLHIKFARDKISLLAYIINVEDRSNGGGAGLCMRLITFHAPHY